ncbi:MAG: hypothetical protein QME51_04395 [Planctomycetota bacterium]|nr:hypothetical protein [Planctomycetota bacterium]MDI6787590.1 hypothetical protein [Planctomycetota bacterium]
MNKTIIYSLFIALTLIFSGLYLITGEEEDIDKIIDELDKELKPLPVEEEIDVMGILNRIIDKMETAEDRLFSASNLVNIEEDTSKTVKTQKEILEELNKLFQHINTAQSDAMEGLRKIIESAMTAESKESTGASRGTSPRDQQQPKPKPKPKEKRKEGEQDKGQGPAPRAYDAKGDLPDPYTPRRSDARKWGNLPPKLRDEIIQSAQEEFLPEYQDRLSRYFKILAGEE